MRSQPILLACALALASAGCGASNRLGQAIQLERVPYTYRGEALDSWVAIPPDAEALPLVIFVEGDGGECQAFSASHWRRFLVRSTGRFVFVRPRTLVNATCGTGAWAALDFRHRVDELDAVVQSVRASYPRRRLVLFGHSAGAHVARLYAARCPAVDAIIDLSGGYDELAEVMRDLAGASVAERGEAEAHIASVRALPPEAPFWRRSGAFWQQMFFSGVKPLWLAYDKPCLVLHGTRDETSVPWEGVRSDGAEVARAGGRCRLVALEGAGHDTLGTPAFAQIDAWLAETGLLGAR